MTSKFAVLLIGFGGPQRKEEVRPFLESVLTGVTVSPERFEEVLRHYENSGNVSPYISMVYKQKEALQNWLKKNEIDMPVGAAFRHSTPTFQDALEIFKRFKADQVIGFVLSPFRCYSSFEKYLAKIEEAKKAAAISMKFTYTESFFDHPLFIESQTSLVREAGSSLTAVELSDTYFLFSAHSIPLEMPGQSVYLAQFKASVSLMAKKLDLDTDQWSMAYQSRSLPPPTACLPARQGRAGAGRQAAAPWLEPDVKTVIQSLVGQRFKNIVLVPVGFVCDNVEILYDLDVEARKTAEDLKFKYFRASPVNAHPLFIEMMGRQIVEKLEQLSLRGGTQ